VCLIDICESISIARALAQQNQYQLNPTQELRALGYANLAGALFNCYTTTGSFSRSGALPSCPRSPACCHVCHASRSARCTERQGIASLNCSQHCSCRGLRFVSMAHTSSTSAI
jgi:hypothetical protein